MARNGSGVMEQLPDTRGVAGEVIKSAKYNAVVDDIIAEMNLVLPAARGGTGYASMALALAAAGFGTIADLFYRSTAGQLASGGAHFTPYDLGTKSSGTLTIDVSNGPYQKVTAGGAFTLAVDTTKIGNCTVIVTNNGSAGAIDQAAFGSNVYGDVYVTTASAKFAFDIRVLESGWPELTIRKKA